MKIYIKTEKGFQKLYVLGEKEGRTMNWGSRYIKKLMGWCPNAKTLKTESQISSANFEANDRSEEEKAGSLNIPSQHSRLDTLLLLLPIFFTPCLYKPISKRYKYRRLSFLALHFLYRSICSAGKSRCINTTP